jgi:hypothetical protein
MPYLASRRLLAGACFEETAQVFSSTNSEQSPGSLADMYVIAAEFWTTTAPQASLPVI